MAFLSLKGMPTSNASTPRSLNISVGKVVNPLGTVTTITESPQESIIAANEFTEEYSSGAYIHENCDEAMFRPYVAVISGNIDEQEEQIPDRPEPIGQKLIVPVIDGAQLKAKEEKARRREREEREEKVEAKLPEVSVSEKSAAPQSQSSSAPESKKEKKKNAEREKDKKQPKWVEKAKQIDMVDIDIEEELSILRLAEGKEEGSVEKAKSDRKKSFEILAEAVPVKREALYTKETAKEIEFEFEMARQSLNVVELEHPQRAESKVLPMPEPTASMKVERESKVECKEVVEVPLSKLKKKNKSAAKANEPAIVAEPAKQKIVVQPAEPIWLKLDQLAEDAQSKSEQSEESGSEKSRKKKSDGKEAKLVIGASVAPEQASLDRTLNVEASPEPDAAVPEETIKGKKTKRQRKLERTAVEGNEMPKAIALASVEVEPEITEFTFSLKDKRPSAPSDGDDFAMIESLKGIDEDACSKIQESLLRNPVVATTVLLRKSSKSDADDLVEVSDPDTGKSKKRRKPQKEVESAAITPITPDEVVTTDSSFTFADAVEQSAELDNLSFKSTTDDPICLIGEDSPLQETSESASLNERTTDYDKLSDEIDICADAQFSDCKNSDAEMKTSESSDETEDSSSRKKSKAKKSIIDDEELQPLIDSPTSQSDNVVESIKSETLPDEVSQSDSTKPIQLQHQQSNKKKSRKKRR